MRRESGSTSSSSCKVGGCIEFKSGPVDVKWTWGRLRRGGLTHFSGIPTIFMRMMRYYEEVIAGLPRLETEAYRASPGRLKAYLCGTSAPPKPINDFWTGLLGGRRILQRYGSTETGVVFDMMGNDQGKAPDGSVGEATVGVDVKLSEGDEGEGWVLPNWRPRSEGGKYYFVIGRASVNIIKSGGYKISALDVEREILGLPYIAEVIVVVVVDLEFGHRVGAVVSLRSDKLAQDFYRSFNRPKDSLSIDDLRSSLRSRLAGYKMPTLLRAIDSELPKSISGKVVKKTLGPKYFPQHFDRDPDVQTWSRAKSALMPKL